MANFSAGQREKEKEIDVFKTFCDFLQAVDRGGGYFVVDYIIYYCYVIYYYLIKILINDSKVKANFSGLPHVRKWSGEKSSSRSGKVTEFYFGSGKMKPPNIEPRTMLK